MKKRVKILIILSLILLGLVGIFFIVKDIVPVDDTKKLYISCHKINDSYEVITGEKINFSKENSSCNLSLEIRNVDRNFIKLKSSVYLYNIDGNGEVNEDSLFNDIYVTPNEKLILYSLDKETKFEFMYK